ncbi:hypothetical protein PR048_011777 [Dryococelus australis]|uniref:Tc1-like transposase DDE domain-containing protein n=1 Tax=Dryococelus australis TaxID=614101 RepID=A0ABQ9HN63_9NEOP|nr:hypothetical protein PR048_011777 [Dryococelus australis]
MLEWRTPLVPFDGTMTGERYIREVLRPVVRPFRKEIGDEFILADDNTRPHREGVESDMTRMQLPAISPNMNCVEHEWDMLKCAISQRPHPPMTRQVLIEAAVEEWDRLPSDDQTT